jgi:NAD(P)-dependent dehydrogenase (short-subunit alcohol dehydrogenase family)
VAARRDRAGRDAAARIAASAGNPHVRHILQDLADLDLVAGAAAGWSSPLHIVASNAGIMAVPELTRAAQSHELQFATNYLSHFALTAGLRTALAAAGQARRCCPPAPGPAPGPPPPARRGDLAARFRDHRWTCSWLMVPPLNWQVSQMGSAEATRPPIARTRHSPSGMTGT